MLQCMKSESEQGPLRPFHLGGDAFHLDRVGRALAIHGFDHDYGRYLAQYCSPEDAGRLLAVADTPESWPAWEMHPAGDEVVIVLSGRADFLQKTEAGIRRIRVGPRDAIINPAGVPHTADVIEPLTALYLTPCPGTTHFPRQGDE